MDYKFTQLLEEALSKPGKLADCFHAFHGYSLGNQIAAMVQCDVREIPIGPIASYKAWQEKGRQVRKGEKALWLCMPITCKVKADKLPAECEGDPEKAAVITRFIWRPNWFTLSQTDGTDLQPTEKAPFDLDQCLQALEIEKVEFQHLNGNCQGYATKRSIAINPLAVTPFKTAVHEIAHILLGHTAENTMTDGDTTPRGIREVEAESVAYLVSTVLGMDGLEESRGYIQHWFGSRKDIPEKSAQKIFKAADQILHFNKKERD